MPVALSWRAGSSNQPVGYLDHHQTLVQIDPQAVASSLQFDYPATAASTPLPGADCTEAGHPLMVCGTEGHQRLSVGTQYGALGRCTGNAEGWL